MKMICDSKVHMLTVVARVLSTYNYFVTGSIPEGKSPERVDVKLAALYDCEACRTSRQRRRRSGLANALYFRCERVWLLMATEGRGEIKDSERLSDARRAALTLFGHSLKIVSGSVVIRVNPEAWAWVKAETLKEVYIRDAHVLEAKLRGRLREVGLVPFKGTIEQQRQLLDLLNHKRHLAGLPKLRKSCLIYRRDN